jgi:hypothetical protein
MYARNIINQKKSIQRIIRAIRRKICDVIYKIAENIITGNKRNIMKFTKTRKLRTNMRK